MSNEISALLKRAYDAVLKEPVPDFLKRVLEQASKDLSREAGQ